LTLFFVSAYNTLTMNDFTDKLIPLAEAAKLLSTSKSSVGRWAADGILTVVRLGRNKRYYLSEVINLKNIRDRGLKPKRISEDVVVMKYKLAKLERLFQHMCTVIRFPDRLHVFTDVELVHLYNQALKISRARFRSQPFKFEVWRSALLNIHEEELKRLKHLTGDPVPFVPFIALCERVVSLGKVQKNKYGHGPMRYSDWIEIFLLLRNELRDRAIMLLTEEAYDFGPIKRVDAAVTNFLDEVAEDEKEKKQLRRAG